MTENFEFKIAANNGHARAGLLRTAHGVVPTPAFMPVGTRASVKAVTPDEVRASGASIVLGNTYHLMLRPGEDLIRGAGGLARFMAWDGPTLTDSGGFQVFSLGELVSVADDGVRFSSHIDGKKVELTPQRAVEIQAALGSDIAMALDVCPPATANREEIELAIRRTTLWAGKQLEVERPSQQALFGIIQGGTHVDLRLSHLEELVSMGFDGLALGGFSVGEPLEEMYRVLAHVGPEMPRGKPRYLMGVGTPRDILEAIGCGIDMFDCVLPTRNARNGQVFVRGGRLNIKQARFANDSGPIDSECDCPCCVKYERRYLRHLFNVGELLVYRLLTLHNLRHWGDCTAGARKAIEEGRFDDFKKSWCEMREDQIVDYF